MRTVQLYTTDLSPKFVIALHCCRHRNTDIMRALDPLYPPEAFEVLDVLRTPDAGLLRDDTVDDWGYAQVVDLVKVWPKARACIVITTAVSRAETSGKPVGIDAAYGYGDGNFESTILNRHSLQKALGSKSVPYPNLAREVHGRLKLFIRKILGATISEQEKRLLAGPR